jgi:hypothetical protein
MRSNRHSEDALAVFQVKQIRQTWHDNQRYSSVVDTISILSDSPTPRQYLGKVKDRAFKEKAKEAAVS